MMSRYKDDTSRAELRALLSIAAPLAGSRIVSVLQNTTDTVFAARYSLKTLEALSLGQSVSQITLTIFMGLLAGVEVVFAKHFNSENKGKVLECLGGIATVTILLCILALSVTPLGWLLPTPPYSNQSINVFGISSIGVPGALIYVAASGVIAAAGRARVLMWVMVFAFILNLIGDAVVVVWSDPLKIPVAEGIVTVTALVRWLTAFVAITIVYRTIIIQRLVGPVRYDAALDHVRVMFAIGWPAGLAAGVSTFSISFCLAVLARTGVRELAAAQIALALISLVTLASQALAVAVSVRGVALIKDAERTKGLSHLAYAAVPLGIGITLAAALIGVGLPSAWISLFSRDQALVPLASACMIASVFVVIGETTVMSLVSYHRALGNARTPSLLKAGIFLGSSLGGVALSKSAGGSAAIGLFYGVACGLMALSVYLTYSIFRREGPQVEGPPVSHPS